jgi:hypothetical protein
MNYTILQKSYLAILLSLISFSFTFAQTPDEIYEIYEIDTTLTMPNVFSQQADLRGGIIGSMLVGADSWKRN